MTLFQSLIVFVPLGTIIIGMFVRVEHRLTKIETNLNWITKLLKPPDNPTINP